MIALDVRLLRSLTLAEVIEGWSLQDRVDRKYLVPTETLGELIAGRRAEYGVLQIDQRFSATRKATCSGSRSRPRASVPAP